MRSTNYQVSNTKQMLKFQLENDQNAHHFCSIGHSVSTIGIRYIAALPACGNACLVIDH